MVFAQTRSSMLDVERRSWVTIARLREPDFRDSESLLALETQFRDLAESQGPRPVILNCSCVHLFGSTFVSKLLGLRRRLLAQGSSLTLCDLSKSLAVVMERMRMHTYFQVCRDEREALARLDTVLS